MKEVTTNVDVVPLERQPHLYFM